MNCGNSNLRWTFQNQLWRNKLVCLEKTWGLWTWSQSQPNMLMVITRLPCLWKIQMSACQITGKWWSNVKTTWRGGFRGIQCFTRSITHLLTIYLIKAMLREFLRESWKEMMARSGTYRTMVSTTRQRENLELCLIVVRVTRDNLWMKSCCKGPI